MRPFHWSSQNPANPAMYVIDPGGPFFVPNGSSRHNPRGLFSPAQHGRAARMQYMDQRNGDGKDNDTQSTAQRLGSTLLLLWIRCPPVL
ncbi:hypothetical protein FQN55_006449 [Onygenales sp. PD_40]|nr:hypothetical protein FQN55_006449 [Onygenales sp. PD_40]